MLSNSSYAVKIPPEHAAEATARMVRMIESGAECWHWHRSIMLEMSRLADAGAPVFSADGIAGNLRGFTGNDTRRYLRQMIAAGVVSEAPAAWDYADLWVTLS